MSARSIFTEECENMAKDTTMSMAGTKRSFFGRLVQEWQLWVMLLPAIVYIFVFCYMPMYGV